MTCLLIFYSLEIERKVVYMKKIIKYNLILFLMIFIVGLVSCNKEYTITCLNEDGSVYTTVNVNHKQGFTKPVDPIKEGYTFIGWFNGDEKWNYNNYEVTEDMTVVAKFEINKYTITFETGGGSVIPSITKEYNDLIETPSNPVREGYEFVGWDKEIPNTIPAQDLTITAIWKKDNIKIVAISPLSSYLSMYGQAVKNGIELAVEEINANGGVNINGEMVKLEISQYIDDKGDLVTASNMLANMISQNETIDFVIGPVTSSTTELFITNTSKYGIPTITPTGTADKLTVGDNGDERDVLYNLFRACFNDSYQGEYMAKYAAKAGNKRAYVLYNNDDDYSKGLKDAFVETAKSLNIEVVTAFYDNNNRDFNTLWGPIIEGGYDCVYVPDYYENAYNILKTGYEKGYTGVCYGSDGWDGLITQVGPNDDISFLENCFYTNHFFSKSENETVKLFVEKYLNKYSSIPSSFAALGYDAVYIAKQAIESAGSVEYDKVIESLNTGTFSGLVTSSSPFTYSNGNPQKEAFIVTFKDGKEVEAVN